jgi:hypothetical protein
MVTIPPAPFQQDLIGAGNEPISGGAEGVLLDGTSMGVPGLPRGPTKLGDGEHRQHAEGAQHHELDGKTKIGSWIRFACSAHGGGPRGESCRASKIGVATLPRVKIAIRTNADRDAG